MIPNYESKYDAEALFSPQDAVAEQGDGLPDVPPAVVLGYQTELTDVARERATSRTTVVRGQDVERLSETVGYVPVHESGCYPRRRGVLPLSPGGEAGHSDGPAR